MLYGVFNSVKESLGQDYFTARVSDLPATVGNEGDR